MTPAVTKRHDRQGLSVDERRYYREWSIVIVLGLATLALLTTMQWGQSFGFLIYDQFQRWWPAQPSDQVVVIEVDDRTLGYRGGWPIDRSVYADLLRKLADSQNHPKAIGFDILFADAMPADAAFAQQMKRHQVFLSAEPPRTDAASERKKSALSPLLESAAQGVAHINLSFEKDGSIRGVRLIEGGIPQLALAMMGDSRPSLSDKDSYRRLHFVHPLESGPTVSLADVLSGLVPLEFFKDRYVLIGATAPSLGDHFPTLYSGDHQTGTPGVMLHANLLGNLLNDELVRALPVWIQTAFSCLVLLLAMIAVLVLSPLAELVVNLTIACCTLALSFLLLIGAHRWFDPSLCVIAIALVKPAWVWRRNEMIVSYMGARAATLEKNQRPRRKLGFGLRLRHFASDTLLQYSRMLDNAIDMVSNRLTFLQRLVAQVPVAMLVADAQGSILLANPGMTQVFSAELVGQGKALQGLLIHLGLPFEKLEGLAERDQLVSAENGTSGVSHYILRMAPIDEGGDSPLWVLSLTDVTEMRQFQTQREQTLQLLSHDMRTPVASIMALSRQSQTPDTSSSASDDIHRHARTLLDMMDDFIYSIQSQLPRYRRREALMDELVNEAIHQVKDLAQSRQMALCLEQDEEPIFVLTEQRLFIRVLANVLVNAVRYGQMGTPIRVVIVRDDDDAHPRVRCRISNTVGQEGAAPMPETGKSFGLGLTFVKTVMHKHEGEFQMHIPAVAGDMAWVELTLPVVP